MKTPPMLIATALLFWGALTGYTAIAAIMATILEGSRFMRVRWEFSDTEFNRIWDLCSLLFIGAAVYFYASQEITNSAYVFVQWLPLVFFPMIFAQAYGNKPDIGLKTFSWFLRKRSTSHWALKRINISYLYFSVVLLGSSATNPANRWFYPAAVALIVWAIAAARPPRFPRWSFVLFAALAAGGGYFGHTQLREVQSRLESAFVNWLGGAIRRPGTSAREARTALGQIGRLKLSGRIVLHVEPETGEPPPLLREASYNSLQRNTYWYNTNRSFERVPLEANDVWKLLPKKKTTRAVTVSASLERGAGILALPAGAAQLENLLVGEVGTNILGVVRVAEGPGLVSYRASYGPGQTIDSEPGPTDLAVPEGEKAALSEIVAQLDLASKTDAEKLRLIAGFFQNNFKYSTWLAAGNSPMESETPVTRFLRTTRSGHCEFFATATTLLLRQARIPARYAVGYAVMESAKSGRTFLVRERHAHAWTLVWNKDRRIWEDFDTTPASWDAVESENASFWEPLADFWSAVKYQLARMRWGKTNYRQYLVWALVPMILFLAWRIIFNRQRKRARLADEAVAVARDWPGLDSEFYLVEQKLAQRGFQRWENETLADWLGRIQKTSTDSVDGLRAILPLHYRYRFDPRGLTAEERRDLGRKVKSWLAT